MVAAYVPEGDPPTSGEDRRPSDEGARPRSSLVVGGGFVLVFVAGSGNAGGPAAATASATNTPICLATQVTESRRREDHVSSSRNNPPGMT